MQKGILGLQQKNNNHNTKILQIEALQTLYVLLLKLLLHSL